MLDDIKDIDEVTVELQSIARQLQITAQDFVEQLKPGAQLITGMYDQTVRLSKAQQVYMDKLGNTQVTSAQISILEQRAVIVKKLQGDLSEAERDHQTAILERLDQQYDSNERLGTLIENQATSHLRSIGQLQEKTELEVELAEVESKILLLAQKKNALGEEEFERTAEHLDQQKNTIKYLIREEKYTKAIDAQRAASTKLLGVDMAAMEDKAKEIGDLLSSRLGILIAIALVAKKAFSIVADQMQEIRNQGFGISQSWELTRDHALDVGGYFERFSKYGLLAFNVGEQAGALAGLYGDMAAASDEAVAQALLLGTNFGLAAGEAAQIINTLEKTPGFTHEMRDDFIATTNSIAKINKLAPGALFKDIADHSELFARYGTKGANEFIRASAAVRKMGIDLSTLESVRDHALDFDSFIQNITKLRTLGINFQDPFRLSELAQSGDIAALGAELQGQLQAMGRDLTVEGLGGTIQANAVLETFGVQSLAELQRAMSGEAIEDADPNVEIADSKRETMISSLFDIGKSAGLTNTLLGLILAATIAKKGFLGGLPGLGRLGGLFRKSAVPAVESVDDIFAGRGAAAAAGRFGGLGGKLTGAARLGGRATPLIGTGISVATDLASGESAGKTAFGAAGTLGGGIAGGALTGAAIGSIFPGIGTAIGGLIGLTGAIAGSFGGRWLGRDLYEKMGDSEREGLNPITGLPARPSPVEDRVFSRDLYEKTGDPEREGLNPITGLPARPSPVEDRVFSPSLYEQPAESTRVGLIPTGLPDSLSSIEEQSNRRRDEVLGIQIEERFSAALGGVEEKLIKIHEALGTFQNNKIDVILASKKVGQGIFRSYARGTT